ncbi:MAG: signal peptidase II [Bacilli bacterium]
MKSLNKVYFIALIVFLMDFLSKNFVINNFELLKSIELIPNFFYITYLQNTGAAWGMFENGSIIIAIVSLIIFILISNYLKKLKLDNLWSIISFGFLLGGILGNFIDRVVYGYVIDFLDFKIFGYDYPVFNFADIMIVVGTIMIAIKIIRGDKDANNC